MLELLDKEKRSNPLSDCRAKNPATCRYHSREATIRKEMNIIITGNTGEYEKYARLSNELASITLDIVLAEETNPNKAINGIKKLAPLAMPSEKLKSAIAQKIKDINQSKNFDKVNWGDYVEVAVGYQNPQSYGATIEKLWRLKGKYEDVSASEGRGDFRNPTTGEYTEFKFSAFSRTYATPTINLVQIRPHHTNDNYHIVVYDKEKQESHFFVLTKEQMAEELIEHSSRAHGRVTDKPTSKTEYAIRFRHGDARWDKWVKNYGRPFPH